MLLECGVKPSEARSYIHEELERAGSFRHLHLHSTLLELLSLFHLFLQPYLVVSLFQGKNILF